jgi:hypothetical protein
MSSVLIWKNGNGDRRDACPTPSYFLPGFQPCESAFISVNQRLKFFASLRFGVIQSAYSGVAATRLYAVFICGQSLPYQNLMDFSRVFQTLFQSCSHSKCSSEVVTGFTNCWRMPRAKPTKASGWSSS